MRLWQLRHFVPRRGYRHGLRNFRRYVGFRLETLGRQPTLREMWDYLGWCQEFNRAAKRRNRQPLAAPTQGGAE